MSRKVAVVFVVWTTFYLGAFALCIKLLLEEVWGETAFAGIAWLCLLFALTQIVRFGWILQFRLSTKLTGSACALFWAELGLLFFCTRYLNGDFPSIQAPWGASVFAVLTLLGGRVFDFVAVKAALPIGTSSEVTHE